MNNIYLKLLQIRDSKINHFTKHLKFQVFIIKANKIKKFIYDIINNSYYINHFKNGFKL